MSSSRSPIGIRHWEHLRAHDRLGARDGEGIAAPRCDALTKALRDAPAPAGRLLFAAGPVDGGWQVVQVWSSQAELDAFNREHFLPALASLGTGGFPAPPTLTDFSTAVLTWGG